MNSHLQHPQLGESQVAEHPDLVVAEVELLEFAETGEGVPGQHADVVGVELQLEEVGQLPKITKNPGFS